MERNSVAYYNPGEFVRRANTIGLVIETKEKYLQQYCWVLWVGDETPEWVWANQLREYIMENKEEEKNGQLYEN